MSIRNAALNFGFSAEQAARLAAADRTSAETVAQQLRQSASQTPFASGTTVTASYRYKVAEDGSFIPLQTQITTEAASDDFAVGDEQGRNGRRASRQNQQERQQSLRDYSGFKPQLSPSDEAVIFSSVTATVPNFASSNYAPKISVNMDTNIAAAEVQDEAGNFVQAEVISPKTDAQVQQDKSQFSASFRRAQFSVAALYARSGSAVNVPVNAVQFAA